MKKVLYVAVFLSVLISLILIPATPASARLQPPPRVQEQLVVGIGAVIFNPVEGGCWGIAEGRRLYAVPDMPEEYQVLGIRVVFIGRVIEVSIFMWGTPIELLYIQEWPSHWQYRPLPPRR